MCVCLGHTAIYSLFVRSNLSRFYWLKCGRNIIKIYENYSDRYFKVADSSRALQSLDLKYPLTVDATMDEYRKELRRQSELIRGSEIKNPKWWEDTSSKFHYNYHKNKIMELSADLDRADYHRDMFDAYCAKIEKRSKQFWSDSVQK